MNLAIGDEQTPGYNPKAIDNRYVSKPLTKALGERTICKGVKGASITLKNKGNLMHQLNQFSLHAYDRIFLFYGANDYFYSKDNLGILGQKLTQAVSGIKKDDPWIKIYGILPLPMYNSQSEALAGKRGPAYYTLHGLLAMLGITYANNAVHSLNWMTLTNPIINRNNYKQRLINGRYPTKETSQLMANRIRSFVKAIEHN